MAFDIDILVIPHVRQRYNTIGDWYWDEVRMRLCIRISSLDNWKYEALIGIHELVEVVFCRHFGVTEKQVDDWDMSHIESDDPGSILGCPYYYQHKSALIVEKIVAHIMNIDWDVYEGEIERVSLTYPTKINEKKEENTNA